MSPIDRRICVIKEEQSADVFIKHEGRPYRCLDFNIQTMLIVNYVCRKSTNTFKSPNVQFSVFF